MLSDLLERNYFNRFLSVKMLFLAVFVVVISARGAFAGSATHEAMDEDVATGRAFSKVPQGKK